MAAKRELRTYTLYFPDGSVDTVQGNRIWQKNGMIEVWNLAGEGHTAADDVLVAIVPNTVAVYES